MSGGSSKDSVSLQKGFFKRMLGQDQSRTAKQVKQRHPGFAVSNEATVTPGRTVRPQEVVISPAIKQLNKDGYVVFNTPEKQDIYITVQPESAFFEDEEPEMVRMAGGSFVGANRSSNYVEIVTKPKVESEPIEYVQPADIFSNASRREMYEEIDFSEIIIKKNESFEEEIEAESMPFRPLYREVQEIIMEEPFKMENVSEVTKAASEDVEMERSAEVSFIGYREIPEYELEETPVDELVVEEAPVMDVPAGLYVDGYRPIDIAKADIEGSEDMSSFVERSMDAETAITSDAAPLINVMETLPAIPADFVTYLPVLKEVEISEEMVLEESMDTVADVPRSIDVIDPVADIMKLTVPELYISEELLSEFSKDVDAVIPEDGLESYDCMFSPFKTTGKDDNRACSVSFGFEGVDSEMRGNTSVNFKF